MAVGCEHVIAGGELSLKNSTVHPCPASAGNWEQMFPSRHEDEILPAQRSMS